MLIVACVEVGDYLGRGVQYVRRLRAMVRRQLAAEHWFVVLSDQPWRYAGLRDVVAVPVNAAKGELQGWWAKVALFAPQTFPAGGRVLFLDLDTILVAPLERLAAAKGILHLADWGWKKNDYGSGVMVWDAGEHADVWTRYTADVPQRFRGDQDWLTHLRESGIDAWPALPKGLCVSYRYVSRVAPPAGAAAVCFHGQPKPHELADGWVPQHWRD